MTTLRTRLTVRSLLTATALAITALPAADAANPAASASIPAAPIPLASHPQGQAMLQQALSNLSLSVNFKFLDKTYENDQYTNVAGQKVRTSCLRFRATSGFGFSMGPPSAQLTAQGLRVVENINKIDANGLTVKLQVGPCMDIAGGFGVKLTDVKVVYEARPVITYDSQGYCRLTWNEDPDSLRVAIGDLNIIGVQNNLDKLAKDAVREGANRTFKTVHELLRNDLTKISVNVCGNKKQNPLLK